MDMNGSELVLHMSREMYSQPDDMLHHQSNITFYIDTKTMTKINGRKMPYASHSLSQYVKYDGDRLVFLDHGDAYPRALVMNTLENDTLKTMELFKLDGATGDNFTGTTADALEIGADGYLIAGASMPHQNAVNGITGAEEGKFQHNIYLISVPQNGGAPIFRWITANNPSDKSREVGEPRFVKLTNDRFVLLYDDQALENGKVIKHTLRCLLLDSKGNILAQSSYDGIHFTSNSNPIALDGRIVWASGAQAGAAKIYAVPIPQESGAYRLGDVNGDGEINLKDAILIQQHLAKVLSLTQKQSKAADTDKNGTVSTADVLIIQKFIAKMIPEI